MNETIFAAVLFWSFGYLKLEIAWDLVLPPSPLRATSDRLDLRVMGRKKGFRILDSGFGDGTPTLPES